MSDSSQPHHALTAFMDSMSHTRRSNSDFLVTVRPQWSHINLRGDPDNLNFLDGSLKALGQTLPTTSNTISDGARQVYWLGPDEWLVVAPAAERAHLLETLDQNLADVSHSINDVSAGQLLLELTGPCVTEVLAQGCTLDFHPDHIAVGTCAQSNLAKASVLLGQPAEPGTFTLIVRRSYAEYVAHWLQQASEEFGFSIQAN